MQISDEILEINGENVCEYDREEEDDDDDNDEDINLNQQDEYKNYYKKNTNNNNNHSQIISYIHDVSNTNFNFVL